MSGGVYVAAAITMVTIRRALAPLLCTALVVGCGDNEDQVELTQPADCSSFIDEAPVDRAVTLSPPV